MGKCPRQATFEGNLPEGQAEIQSFSSPGLVGDIITKRIQIISSKLNECSLTRRTGCQARNPHIFAVNKGSNQ